MNGHPDIVASKLNRAKAIEIIPIKLKVQEEKLFDKVRKSKINVTKKLVNLYEFMEELASGFSHLTPYKKAVHTVVKSELMYLK